MGLLNPLGAKHGRGQGPAEWVSRATPAPTSPPWALESLQLTGAQRPPPWSAYFLRSSEQLLAL